MINLDTTLLSLLLPEGILEYFELTNVIKKEDSYYLFLSEKNLPPQEFQSDQLQSKGFYEEETVRDFPLRGKACYLKIKRRKWLNLSCGKTVYRDWEMVADGTRMTKEFATFLKGLSG